MRPSAGTRQPISRRTVLLSVAGVVIGATELRLSMDSPHGSFVERAALAGDVGAPAAIPTRLVGLDERAAVSVSTTAPPWAKRWRAPVYDLGDFLRRSPQAHFPKRSVMLTVDDGPQAYWTPKYLRLFEKYDVKATFNLIGEQVPSQRKLVRAMASEGHVLANHTWTHDERLPFRSPGDIHGEIARTNDVIEKAARIRPQIFRAPGGVWGPRVFDELAREQMLPLGWNIDPRDWALPGTGAIEYAMLQARPGNIILCHDGGGNRDETFAALQRVIPALKKRGLHFATLPLQ